MGLRTHVFRGMGLQTHVFHSTGRKTRATLQTRATTERVLPPRRRRAVGAGTAVNRAVVLDQLGRDDPHDRARRPLHGEAQHERGVLAEVVHLHSGPQFAPGHRLKHFKCPERRRCMRKALQHAAGPGAGDRRRPRRVVESRPVPAVRLQAGVIILAAKHIRKRDGAGRAPPAFVGRNGFHRAVRVLEADLRDRGQRTERRDELHVAPAAVLHVVHATGERQADGVGPGLQPRGEVEGVVEAGLRVVGPAGREKPGVHARAVERQFVLAEAADKREGPAQPGAHDELAAQPQRPVGERIHARNTQPVHHRRRRPKLILPAVARRDHGAGGDVAAARHHLDLAERQAGHPARNAEHRSRQPQVARGDAVGGNIVKARPWFGEILRRLVDDDRRLAELGVVGGLDLETPRKTGHFLHGMHQGAQAQGFDCVRLPQVELDPFGRVRVAGLPGMIAEARTHPLQPIRMRNPAGRPAGRIQLTHRPGGGRTPCRSPARAIPHAHLPEQLLRAAQRPPGGDDAGLVVRLDAAAVPDVAAVGVERGARRRHQYLPGRLPQAAAFALQPPGKPRRRGVNAERVDRRVAPQVNRRQPTGICRRGAQRQDQPGDRQGEEP